ncbi:M56 family metallopeptidase [Frateuria hangzhouensis]|uniref:M56 family metallopeptidase n=1 Tax=Frateuria hangzhouensis TaxID=2995589 RepID=UPI002260AA7D|nr:M56 family metallopeptidase [Frateuria sp. STR12]MCX7513752.1 peptidase M56 [Frateuria sp. STR12]
MSADWTGPAWLLVLACTGALACVALVRRPCRRWFGAESAFVLWGLPPLAMVASLLPHAPAASGGALSGMAWVVVSAADAWPRAQGAPIPWQDALAWAWWLGAATSLARAAVAQGRFRRRLLDAVPYAGSNLPWPVLRATTADTGPALVGAWHPRIVVPADFAARYSNDEQALILAHEAMHARRRDGWWSLLAQLIASLFWFHPLAWWALGALRRDQELACDAAVLREHGDCRRRYARAMLKTPAAMHALPVGCSWSSRHPLTERIAMLKLPLPGSARRLAGAFASFAFALAMGGVAYAATAPGASTMQHPSIAGREYQLDMQLSVTRDDAQADHAQRTKVALCMAPGETATVSTHDQRIDAITRPANEGRLDIDLVLHGSAGAAPAHLRLQGRVGQPLAASGELPASASRYLLEVTPRQGCPARATAAAIAARPVTAKMQGVAARKAASMIAAQAGFVLVNPEVLDEREVTLHFDQVSAASAMQLVADADGAQAIFDGARVHFEPKPPETAR